MGLFLVRSLWTTVVSTVLAATAVAAPAHSAEPTTGSPATATAVVSTVASAASQRVKPWRLRHYPRVKSPFTVATYNALGDSHTVKGGNRHREYTGSYQRTKWAVQLFNRSRLDVVALQEFEPVQQRHFEQLASSTYAHHGPQANGVAWRSSKFDLVSTDSVTVPYLGGQPTPMPVVRLRSKQSGQEMVFISVHNPADVRGPAQKLRNVAVQRERAHIRSLWAQWPRVPVFLLGDMNDRRTFFCRATADGLLHAAAGGSNSKGRCSPPAGFHGIDWITGTRGVKFSGHREVKSWLVRKSTDHPLALSRVG